MYFNPVTRRKAAHAAAAGRRPDVYRQAPASAPASPPASPLASPAAASTPLLAPPGSRTGSEASLRRAL